MADMMPFTMPQVLDLVNAKYKGKGKWVDVDCPYAKGQKIRVNLSDDYGDVPYERLPEHIEDV